MFIDSHCHLNFPDLQADLDQILSQMRQNQVTHALCANVRLEDAPDLIALVDKHPELFCSIGVHPEYKQTEEPTLERLSTLAQHPKVVAIGECGLDYYHYEGPYDFQHERFRTQIQASQHLDLPLIIHTRAAREDTIAILRQSSPVHGVLHCFTESLEMAKQGLDLGLYISFSGIVTFKNAQELQEVAQYVPLDRILIETDSPYLAPVPYRGKRNDPSKVIHVAEKIAELKGITLEQVARQTTENFFNLFKKAKKYV